MSHRPTLVKVYFKALQEHFLKLLILAAVFAFVAFMVAVVQPREYRASGRLIIVSKGALELDAYTAARAGERLGSILKEVVYSSTFLTQVLKTGGINSDYPINNEERRLKLWKRRVSISVSETSGIVSIDVYHQNRSQATATAKAIFTVAKRDGPVFYGGRGAEIKDVELPIASQKAVRPKLLLATAGGFGAGVVVGAGLIFLMAPEIAARRRETIYDAHFGAVPPEVV